MGPKGRNSNMVGLLFGICGLLDRGSLGAFYLGELVDIRRTRMNLSALAMLIFVAYFILRSAFSDAEKRAKISAVYNIFGVTTIPFLLYIIPRQLPSLHPGAEGNPRIQRHDSTGASSDFLSCCNRVYRSGCLDDGHSESLQSEFR
jgi:heme exporter protein C